MGPSTESINEQIRLLSTVPRSLENLLISIPEGVASKNRIGERSTDFIIVWWMFWVEFRRHMFSRQNFKVRTVKYATTKRPVTPQNRCISLSKCIDSPLLTLSQLASIRQKTAMISSHKINNTTVRGRSTQFHLLAEKNLPQVLQFMTTSFQICLFVSFSWQIDQLPIVFKETLCFDLSVLLPIDLIVLNFLQKFVVQNSYQICASSISVSLWITFYVFQMMWNELSWSLRAQGQPWAAILPFCIIITQSQSYRQLIWWVTRITVFSFAKTLKQFSWISFATFESTAEIGSSKRQISASAYSALAKDRRAFCPPERLLPFSPTIVSSPSSKTYKSLIRQESSIALQYFASSKILPKMILFLIVSENTTVYCSTQAIEPLRAKCPEQQGISERMAAKSELFPEPTLPVIPQNDPFVKKRAVKLLIPKTIEMYKTNLSLFNFQLCRMLSPLPFICLIIFFIDFNHLFILIIEYRCKSLKNDLYLMIHTQ